ncbi:MAG TPA: GTP 3',8-cyclase MoaA [Nitrososphaerales archaeon]|nr:GTP 3',8-cyclase MoaA [Nitrososphaerales archaeon]
MPSTAATTPGLPLTDGKGRVAKKLRISVTDRCNFACLFCMPDKSKVKWLPTADQLAFDEIEHVARVLATMGVESIRVTGGEPLLRPRLEDLVRGLVSTKGIQSVDMTSNGWFLKQKAKALRSAGLRGVTVSLHSLQPDRFAKISGMNALPRVLEGIEEAIKVGLDPVKINSVAIRGYNEDEIYDLFDYAHSRGLSIRFIEFMPLDGLGIWNPDAVITGKEIVDIIGSRHGLKAMGRMLGKTAALWSVNDGPGDLGLITSMSEPFCDDCDRIRLTSDGKLLSCLFDTEYYDLKPYIRDGGSDAKLEAFIREVVKKKPDGVGYMTSIREGWAKPRNMNAIGG